MGPLPMQTLANETSAQNGLAASPQFSDSSQTPMRDGVNLLGACLESKRHAFIYPPFFFLLLLQLNGKIFSFSLVMTLGKVFCTAVQGLFYL